MANRIVVPEGELNSFDLPPICVMTGRRDGVTFRPVKFQWYPRWILIFVFCALIVAAVLQLVMMKRAKGEMPFTDEGFAMLRRRTLVVWATLLGFLVAMVLGLMMLDSHQTVGLGLLVLSAASLVASVVCSTVMPRILCTRIADGQVTLQIPSAEAARVIEQHLHASAGVAALPAVPGL